MNAEQRTFLLFNPRPAFCHRFSTLYRKRHRLYVVAPAEKLFQPDVQANKQIAAPHFLDFEFGLAGSSVAPGNWYGCPGVTANDRLKGNLHREIKMGSNQGTASIDHRFAVRFEGVGRIV